MSEAAQDPSDEFVAASNAQDLEALERCLHPDFEMIVPQKPPRGFVGRDIEVASMRSFFASNPDFKITVLRKARNGSEIWTETSGKGTGLEMSAVVIWTVDEATNTLKSGRYFSEPVQHDAPSILDFVEGLRNSQG